MAFDSRQIKIVPTYKPLISQVKILTEKQVEIDRIVSKIRSNSDRYKWLEQLTGIPADFIAALHNLECGGSFEKHLANGDPIDRPTVNVPAGIPAGTWEECAIAALEQKGWVGNADLDWDDKLLWLWRAESWNGWGHQMYHPEVPTPYLWSGTSVSKPGKYVADGKWDGRAVSAQIGCVAVWLELGIDFGEKQMQTTEQGLKLEICQPAIVPAGVMKIGTLTWLKSSTKMAKDIDASDKYQAHPDQLFPIYKRHPDVAGHYHVELKSGGALRSIYCFSGHASIAMNDDPLPEEIGSDEVLEHKETPIVLVTDKRAVQEQLIRIGLLDPPADGKWGSLSESAARAAARTIGADGELTQAALDRVCELPSFKDLDFKPKDPNDPENVLAVKCIKRMALLGAHIAISTGSDKPTYNIFHVTGRNPDGSKNDDKIDRWNDLRFVVEVSRSGVVTKKLCRLATCQPGRHWIDNPMNSGGTFRILFDKQWFAWVVGRHGSRQYPALVQAGEIQGYRDSDRDGTWVREEMMSGDYMGINIHHGYNSEFVGIMSAGCQVAKSIAGHQEFMRLCKSDRRYICNNGYRFGNISLDGNKM